LRKISKKQKRVYIQGKFESDEHVSGRMRNYGIILTQKEADRANARYVKKTNQERQKEIRRKK